MSDNLGRYHFLAWARRGVGAAIDNPDQGSLPDRASLKVQLALNANNAAAPTQPNAQTVQMFGPGDVTGIDPRHIIRTEPRPFTVNYEPNYLAGIEFDAPDLPWLFTPAAPKNDRLRPWLALIVLKGGEFKPSRRPPVPLPAIDVADTIVLHDLSVSWNWAHVQVSGEMDLAGALTSSPGSVISRLLCPRRLDPETDYTAFLVPAFEIGRQVGLGQDVSAVTHSDPAWKAGVHGALTLPFFYQFEFHTSDAGDFESLVRRLTPRILDAGVGQRPMDVSRPMKDIPSAGSPLGLEGALHSVSTTPTLWNDPGKSDFQSAVQPFINQPSFAADDPANPVPDDPVIAPPIYGRWHAAVQSVDRTAAGWVNELNLDPRNRTAAGFGTTVVQKEHTQLLASAWQQAEGIFKTNQLLKQAQLARAAMQQLYRQHFTIAAPEALMLLTAPLHSRVMASPVTIRATVRGSRVPERMLSGTFRRVTRPRRRVGTGVNTRPALLTRVNSGELAFVPPAAPPSGMVSIEQVSDTLASLSDREFLRRWWWIVLALVILAILIGVVAGIAAAFMVLAVAAVSFFVLRARAKAIQAKVDAANHLGESAFTPDTVAAVPPNPVFQVVPPGSPPPASGGGGPDSAAAFAFRVATSDFFTYVQALPHDPPVAPQLELAALKTTLLARLDPVVTVPRRTLSLVSLSSLINWLPPDPIEPIMAAPQFPQPMYAPLRDLSPQYVLPGVDLIQPDTLGILQVNRAFIEAYMAGLNHEMARQLLFNGYPTDQRGSYFRQFWDVAAYVRQPGDPSDPAALRELLKDIPLEHTWKKPLPLGDHPNRTDIVQDNVVLLVRGELFKRYPNAIIYAGKAKRVGSQRVLDETDERYTIFRGTLSDDITFLGFNLSRDDAQGGTPTSPEGFFFVFQEQPSEPRFGLEPTERGSPTQHWADLAWTNFDGAPGGGGGGGGGIFKIPDFGNTVRGVTLRNNPWRLASQVFSFVVTGATVPAELSPNLGPSRTAIVADAENPLDPNNRWGVNSAQTAYILLRPPFRILIHADLMLPPK
jgi:hypothetical protein